MKLHGKVHICWSVFTQPYLFIFFLEIPGASDNSKYSLHTQMPVTLQTQ